MIPSIPDQLTIIDQKQNSYTSTCPTFTDIQAIQSLHDKLTDKKLPSTFTLLNWNIYKQQNAQWKTALTDWGKHTDLITLQEVKYSLSFFNFIQRYQLHSLHNIAFSYKDRFYGVNTISKASPLQVCGNRYSEPWSIIPKTGLATTYLLQGSAKQLLLINLHGVNFTFTAQPLKEQLAPYFKLIQKHQGPIIVAGDFNTWTDARTKEVTVALAELGFLSVSFTDDHRMTTFGLPLDHILYRHLHVVKAESIPTTASDHSPQLVKFSLFK